MDQEDPVTSEKWIGRLSPGCSCAYDLSMPCSCELATSTWPRAMPPASWAPTRPDDANPTFRASICLMVARTVSGESPRNDHPRVGEAEPATSTARHSTSYMSWTGSASPSVPIEPFVNWTPSNMLGQRPITRRESAFPTAWPAWPWWLPRPASRDEGSVLTSNAVTTPPRCRQPNTTS